MNDAPRTEAAEQAAAQGLAGRGRHVLLLQGPFSWFFTYLGRALRARGARVSRVILCPGDALFWRGPGAVAYRGRPEGWPGWVAKFAQREAVTDLVCLGDGRFWHRAAIAALPGLRAHIVEQGYLRPGWLTVEEGGLGPNGPFPKTPDAIRALADGPVPADPPYWKTGFATQSAMDVAFNLANLLAGRLTFPHFRIHTLDPPAYEWAGWLGKALRWPWRRAARDRALARIAAHPGPVFLFALQLETDFAIRQHGPEGGVEGALARTLASFAAHAPDRALLVVKPHPLDPGWLPWRRQAETAGALFLDGGDLGALFKRLTGIVTVNSTVGLSALAAALPVAVLGRAIYDVPGLTHRSGLDRFWRAPERPEPALTQAFLRALKRTSQIPGHFDGPGARPGAAALAARVLQPRAPAAPKDEAAHGPA
ncbi:MAG: capsular biosynthesis protein [Pseudomonadota bacterium]